MVPIISDLQSSKKCRYYNIGYCKFLKSKCNFFHPEEDCDGESCDKKECNKRHPKICRYYNILSKCRFNDKCLYRHEMNSLVTNDSKIKELENLLKSKEEDCGRLQLLIENKDITIRQLEENTTVQKNVIENLKKEVMIKEKENISLVSKSNEAKASTDKIKEKFAKEKSDLTKQKFKAIEEIKSKLKEANDTISLKDNLLKIKLQEIEQLTKKLKQTIKLNCDFCDEEFTSSVNLKKHMGVNHRKTQNDSNMDKWIMKSGKEPEFKCSYCSFTSTSEFSLTSHKTMRHLNDLISEDSFQCGNCNYKTSSEKDLNLHMRIARA